VLQINSQTSIKRAALLGIGVAMLPDYIVGRDPGLIQLPVSADIPSFDTYFCYPSEMKNSAKLKVFRDFIVAKARNWNF
jgi:DNA-binding transcriptional LysR family regulator